MLTPIVTQFIPITTDNIEASQSSNQLTLQYTGGAEGSLTANLSAQLSSSDTTQVTKIFDGKQFSYKLVITNTGTVDLTNVQLTMPRSNHVDFDGAPTAEDSVAITTNPVTPADTDTTITISITNAIPHTTGNSVTIYIPVIGSSTETRA